MLAEQSWLQEELGRPPDPPLLTPFPFFLDLLILIHEWWIRGRSWPYPVPWKGHLRIGQRFIRGLSRYLIRTWCILPSWHGPCIQKGQKTSEEERCSRAQFP
jgi:hypothetical protein